MAESESIIKLIRALRKAGVKKFVSGELDIEFHPGDAVKLSKAVSDPPAPTEQELLENSESAALQENADAADDEMALMAIENPAQYETLLIERELEELGSGESEVTKAHR